jgi:phosphoribosyl-AMP cyclohydrolase
MAQTYKTTRKIIQSRIFVLNLKGDKSENTIQMEVTKTDCDNKNQNKLAHDRAQNMVMKPQVL